MLCRIFFAVPDIPYARRIVSDTTVLKSNDSEDYVAEG